MFPDTATIFAEAKMSDTQRGATKKVSVVKSLETTPIIEFQNQYFWLSNFFATPVAMDGYVFPASENAFMSGKSKDITWKQFCTTETNPGAMKSAGRKVKLIDNWDVIRIDAMLKALRAKFSDPILRAKLLATGNRQLIEGNRWGDKFWGVCIKTPQHVGQNNLGKLLMQLRYELQPINCE